VGKALLIGVIASASLPLGALIGIRFRIPQRVLAAMLSFAAGALVTALTFEMFAESVEQGGLWRAGLGMFVGAAVLTGLSAMLDRWAQRNTSAEHDPEGDSGSAKLDLGAAASDRAVSVESTKGAAGMALLAAIILDGIPESLVLGVSLGESSGGIALLAAIFVSNFPEALVGAASMREQGRSSGSILALWTGVAALLVLIVVLGAGPLSTAAPETLSLPLAFAAGALLASLADTVIPEAYEEGGPLVALSTTAGFVASFVLSTL